MPVVIELTLTTRSGHYESAMAAYLEFIDKLEDEFDDLRLVLVAGEPGQGLIHGVGIYESAEIAENLANLPFFAKFVDAMEPHLAEPPIREELQLLQILSTDTDIQAPNIGDATLVELNIHIKLGHVSEFVEMHETYAAEFQAIEKDASIILETLQPATGRMRVFVLYQHAAVATEEGVGALVSNFYDNAEPILSEPTRRSELHIVHAFSRG